ncbi:hypothetical protein CEXT_700351 [Caerostris extrusa]|uniref:Uncharacterized protein n=1 Tax=Caerostris extrusa TaxID=172846 RepID=A0AAV4RUN4_CAEEX|nr:hypothetical protein CEXT_700351 [Caerostris extrusa]
MKYKHELVTLEKSLRELFPIMLAIKISDNAESSTCKPDISLRNNEVWCECVARFPEANRDLEEAVSREQAGRTPHRPEADSYREPSLRIPGGFKCEYFVYLFFSLRLYEYDALNHTFNLLHHNPHYIAFQSSVRNACYQLSSFCMLANAPYLASGDWGIDLGLTGDYKEYINSRVMRINFKKEG